MNVVTITSSKLSANASSAPASSAERICGNVMSRKLRTGVAPRSAAASSIDADVRRNRATTLLNTITMQNVAWATTMVHSARSTLSTCVNVAFRAMPVTMPGSAIGSTTRNDSAFLPKKSKRASANAASDPRIIAIAVAASPTLTLVSSASRTPWL